MLWRTAILGTCLGFPLRDCVFGAPAAWRSRKRTRTVLVMRVFQNVNFCYTSVPVSDRLYCRAPPFLRAPPAHAPLPSLARLLLARGARFAETPPRRGLTDSLQRGTARHSRGFVQFHLKISPNFRNFLNFRAEGALSSSAKTRHSSSI